MTDFFGSARARTLAPTVIGGAWCRDPSLGVACARLRFLRTTAGGWPTPGLFQGWAVQARKRPASSYFRGEWRALVEILVSHFSAQDAERWASARLAGVRLRGLASWETQGPAAALGMTDCFESPARGRSRLGWWQCREQQVPRLRHRIRKANPMAALGMTIFGDRRSGRLSSRECCWHRDADWSVRATRSFAEKLSSPLFGVILCISVIAGHK